MMPTIQPWLSCLLGVSGGLGGVDEVGWTVAGSPFLRCEGALSSEGAESAPQSLSRNSQRDGAVGSFWGDINDRWPLRLSQVLHLQLESLGLNSRPITDRFVESFKAMWSLNGHSLSKMFTGSRALEGKAKVGPGPRGWWAGRRVGAHAGPSHGCLFVCLLSGRWQVGKLKDGARSVSRTIQSNFFDGVKQEAIKLLLVGDVYSEESADKGRMLLDNPALLGEGLPLAWNWGGCTRLAALPSGGHAADPASLATLT